MSTSIGNFEEIDEASNQRMQLAYQNLPADYWINKSAFTHRFDNFRNMIDRKGDSEKENKLLLEDAILSEIKVADKIALYFGVPWCIQTCSFCDLAYSRQPNAEEKRNYINNLLQELKNYKRLGIYDKKIASAYFGGGTPSILETNLLAQLVDKALDNFNLVDNAVITLEASPATLSEKKLLTMKSRVSRVSLGVQTTDTELRQREGRILPREKLLELLDMTLDHFSLVNVDVLYGMNGQSLESIYLTLSDLIRAGVPSITYYRTELFSGTKSYVQAQESPWESICESNVRKMYFFGKVLLESSGYVESPLGWFIKKNKAIDVVPWSKMVENWGGVLPYFGFGLGAFSTSSHYWMQNVESEDEWRNRIKQGNLPVERFYPLTDAENFLVKFMRHIRAFKKIKLEFILSQNCVDSEVFISFLNQSVKQGLLIQDDEFIELTEAGESVIHWLIDDLVKVVNSKYLSDPKFLNVVQLN